MERSAFGVGGRSTRLGPASLAAAVASIWEWEDDCMVTPDYIRGADFPMTGSDPSMPAHEH